MGLKLYLEFLMGQDDKVEKEINVAGAVILHKNIDGTHSVLLIQRSSDDRWPNVWEFPRGKQNPGEKDIITTLKREVREETGLDIKVIKYIDKYEYIAEEGKRKSTQYNYLCKIISRQKIKLSKEHQDYKFVSSVGEIELLAVPEMKKTIVKVLNIDQQIVNYPETKQVIEETQNTWKRK